jgi:hypothetical protein
MHLPFCLNNRVGLEGEKLFEQRFIPERVRWIRQISQIPPQESAAEAGAAAAAAPRRRPNWQLKPPSSSQEEGCQFVGTTFCN